MAAAKKTSTPNRVVRLCFHIHSSRICANKDVGCKLSKKEGIKETVFYTVVAIAKFKRKKLTELIKLLMQQRIMTVKWTSHSIHRVQFLFTEMRNPFLYLYIMPVLVSNGLLMGICNN